jgi:DNA-binding MarR family transcriptional regulator
MTKKRSSAWSLFLTAHAVLVAAVGRELADAGLPTLEWYDALWALERAPDRRLRLSQFERWMVISRSNITRLVDRLERDGLVRREAAEDDRRGAFAILTADGLAMRKRMWVVYERAIDELFQSHLTKHEQRDVEVVFRKLLAPHVMKDALHE